MTGAPLSLVTKGCEVSGQLFRNAAHTEVNIDKCITSSPVLAKDKSRGTGNSRPSLSFTWPNINPQV